MENINSRMFAKLLKCQIFHAMFCSPKPPSRNPWSDAYTSLSPLHRSMTYGSVRAIVQAFDVFT